MRSLPNELRVAYLGAFRGRNAPAKESGDYLKWLRFYLDFCSKYEHAPRDRDSLQPFLSKLASKRQSTSQQEQATASVEIYYEVIEEGLIGGGGDRAAPAADDPWERCFRELKVEIALRHYSPKTLQTYRGWIRQFQGWLVGKSPDEADSEAARGFLSHLAIDRHVAASTQNQAFNALLFLFRHVLKREYDIGDKVVRAKRRKYIPVVLSRGEVDDVLGKLRDPYCLIVKLLYGCGLRMSECINLRVMDLNFDERIITVHHGKGGKDRTVPLPSAVLSALHEQVERADILHRQDVQAGYHGVFMPTALNRKWPGAAKALTWQWVFPAKTLTLVPESMERRRYHVHESELQKALRGAVKRSGVNKRVTCHTFRHSFASHLLRANYDIRTIQELLGHSDIRTTMIYTHTVRSRTLKEAQSPLDFPEPLFDMLEGFAGGYVD
ncbi:MAG: integron integrase [Verrucomicrobia bacterium]|nr:integron integrase [Verrucomicrobiota bacterium]